MIKTLSIFLISIMLGQSINIHFKDFLKIEELMEHAEFHAEKYGDNFFEFLSKHYGSEKENHKKQHEEEEGHHHFPLDHHDCNSHTISMFIIKKELLFTNNCIHENKLFNLSYQDLFSSFEKQKVFQPPKHV